MIKGRDYTSGHHERTPATRDLSGCIVSPVRRPRLERGGRRFESCHPDHTNESLTLYAGLTQLVECLPCKEEVAGSNPCTWHQIRAARWSAGRPCKPSLIGSIPMRSTIKPDDWPSGKAPVLKTERAREPRRVGSIPTSSAK